MTEHAADPPRGSWLRLREWLKAAPLGALAEFACRAGFVSRGVVYVSLGAIAVMAAAGLAPRAEGAVGALEAWGRWPLGVALLWATGLGLFGFAGWRLLQAVFDADRQGTRPAALANRAGEAVSGLVHAALGFGVFTLIDALGEFRDVDERSSNQETVAGVLAWPGGELAILACGLFIVGVGFGNLVQAAGRPHKRLACPPPIARCGAVLGRLGHLGRGIAFLPLGLAMVRAGREASAGPAQGLGAALDALKDGPFGAAMLAVTGAGLIAFGLFALIEARWRRLGAAEVVEELAAPDPRA